MPPLISREEALSLGELEDRAGIAALVERAWQVRTERFGDSTDMCSLVNAKSGGCAEDCGFCAQSRYAEAATPMHAMMEPEQILEHARAAEAAGAHRFCMVTQGQGLSRRDFDKVLAGARLVAEHTNLKRCVSIGHMTRERRPSTKFGDRELMDPWEAVKWIAIFRLILPDALFRLCGGRVENLGELEATAVKAGLNGVMMGNFLTTLGNTPEHDRATFEGLGLNVARHADNGANPRPDNRSGWLAGETPNVVSEALAIDEPALDVHLWDPSTQLRYAPKRHVPERPDPARTHHPEVPA